MTGNGDRPHVLYRFFNGDELLYVGITLNPGNRWQGHTKDKPWWGDVTRSTMEHFPTRQAVLEAEGRAIATEHPKYNVQRNRRRPEEAAEASAGRLDRISVAAEDDLRPDSLVGSFFHGDVRRGWQGCVVAEVAPGVYLVELFSWMMGESTNQELVRLEDMAGWQFYDTAEWMNNAYEKSVAARWDRERAKRDSKPPSLGELRK